jgi:hypothetical protein
MPVTVRLTDAAKHPVVLPRGDAFYLRDNHLHVVCSQDNQLLAVFAPNSWDWVGQDSQVQGGDAVQGGARRRAPEPVADRALMPRQVHLG